MADDNLVRDRERLAIQLAQKRIDRSLIEKVVSIASAEQLALLEATIASARSEGPIVADELMSHAEYGDMLDVIGQEYVGALTNRTFSQQADLGVPELRDSMEVLAETASMLRAIPPSRRASMAPVMRSELNAALPHYQKVTRALISTGIADALEAHNFFALRQRRVEAIPAFDVRVLDLAGEPDPEYALKQQVTAARAAAQGVLLTRSVAAVFKEGQEHLQNAMSPAAPPTPNTVPPPPPRQKTWSGWGKLLKGTAVIAGNIAEPIAAGVLGATLTANPAGAAAAVAMTGTRWRDILASCAGGVREVCEGVGMLRGE